MRGIALCVQVLCAEKSRKLNRAVQDFAPATIADGLHLAISPNLWNIIREQHLVNGVFTESEVEIKLSMGLTAS